MNDEERPRRETSPEVLIRRAAKKLIAPVIDDLGAWQAETIKIETMITRTSGTGVRDPLLAESTRRLFQAVSAKAAAFDAAIEREPEMVRRHSRVTDTQRVLRLVEERLRTALRDLDAE